MTTIRIRINTEHNITPSDRNSYKSRSRKINPLIPVLPEDVQQEGGDVKTTEKLTKNS